jgi:hypothetical protein
MREQSMTRKELLAKKHEEALIKRIVLISVFCIGAMALVFFYAIPTMVKIADIWDNTRNADKPNVNDVNASIPLVRPQFDNDQNRATNSAEFAINGSAPAGKTVHLMMNGAERPTTVADSSGVFTFSGIQLQEGSNVFVAYSQDERERKSDKTAELRIDLDTRSPKLDVTSPNDGETFGGARASVITLRGKTDEADEMYVNGGWIILKADGTFEHVYQLSPGENILTMYAKDKAGNKSVDVVRKVTYNP